MLSKNKTRQKKQSMLLFYLKGTIQCMKMFADFLSEIIKQKTFLGAWGQWGLNLGPCSCQASVTPCKLCPQPKHRRKVLSGREDRIEEQDRRHTLVNMPDVDLTLECCKYFIQLQFLIKRQSLKTQNKNDTNKLNVYSELVEKTT